MPDRSKKPVGNKNASEKPPKRVVAISLSTLVRPNYDAIIDKMQAEGVDIKLPAKSMISGLWKAIKRRGGFMWMFRTGESVWVVRYSKEPTDDVPNPLPKEYKRHYSTPQGYGHWHDKAESLIQGKVHHFPNRNTAYLFAVSARYHLKKVPDIKPHTVSMVAVKKGFEVSLKWKAEKKKK